MIPSATHLVIIPSFDSGSLLFETVRAARAAWAPIWVVIDGSTDGSDRPVRDLAARDPWLRVLDLPRNSGKGAALAHGLGAALDAGFTHALTMDADGQHPATRIPAFMAASIEHPDALISGLPEFGVDAPSLRVRGRRISNAWARIETLGQGARDSLFGFRVYPIRPLLRIMRGTRWMRRFDFDPEASVRLSWAGVPALDLAAPVRYLRAEDGGVSHFRYGRDNLLLTWMHIRLMLEWLLRWPWLTVRRYRLAGSASPDGISS
ncbi:MAG: glycosyltransferase family 2 protein [Methylotetracoccus sp.]